MFTVIKHLLYTFFSKPEKTCFDIKPYILYNAYNLYAVILFNKRGILFFHAQWYINLT